VRLSCIEASSPADGRLACSIQTTPRQIDSADLLALAKTLGLARPGVDPLHAAPQGFLDQPAFGACLRGPSGGISHGAGRLVLTLRGERNCGLTRFDNDTLTWFGLPRSLPA